jgi:cytochrome c553
MRELADYYAGLAPPQLQSEDSDAALVERGRKLAVEGRSDGGVVPCAACHNNTGPLPRLAGQYAAYMSGQLRLWKAGIGPSTDGGATMMAIAQKLSDEDIKAVASYFETLPRE